MTHWEYPEAVEGFGRQRTALGIAAELQRRGAVDAAHQVISRRSSRPIKEVEICPSIFVKDRGHLLLQQCVMMAFCKYAVKSNLPLGLCSEVSRTRLMGLLVFYRHFCTATFARKRPGVTVSNVCGQTVGAARRGDFFGFNNGIGTGDGQC